MYGLRLVTPPTAEPVSLEEAKAHLRVEHDADDVLISAQIAAAREWAEGFTGSRFLEQTWDVTLRGWPSSPYRIPVGPVGAVSSVTYRTSDGSTALVPPETYRLDWEDLFLTRGASWPVGPAPDEVTLRVVVGSATVQGVSTMVRQAILVLVGHWYANREAVAIGTIVNAVPLAVESLLWMSRRVPL